MSQKFDSRNFGLVYWLVVMAIFVCIGLCALEFAAAWIATI